MRRMGALLATGLIAGSLSLPLRAQESRENREKVPPPAVKLKSEKKAMTLSIVATLVPWAVFVPLGLRESHEPGGEAASLIAALAIPVGPSLGYFYAGSPGRGLLGIGMRIGVIVGLVALGTSLHDAGHDSPTMTSTLFFSGVIAVAGSYVIDIAGIRKAVRRHNLKAQRLQLAFAPLVSPRTRAFGLQARLSF